MSVGDTDTNSDIPADVYTDTALGRIHGRLQAAPQGGEVEEYLGIPFAEPPVGDLRFADPVPSGAFPDGKDKSSMYKLINLLEWNSQDRTLSQDL